MFRTPDSADVKTIFSRLFDLYGPQKWWADSTPFEIAVGTILVQNTVWRNVLVSLKNLENEGLLEPHRMYVAPSNKMASIVKPSGFPRLKTDRIKNFLLFLQQFSFDFKKIGILETNELRGKLLEVNGIGRETADSILLYLFERPVLVVSSYTKRFFSRFGYRNSFDDDERLKFVRSFEEDPKILGEFHALVVQHSKALCRARPLCDECPLSDICYYGSDQVE